MSFMSVHSKGLPNRVERLLSSIETPLYEDNHLIALLKPPGVSVQGALPGSPSLFKETQEFLKRKYQKPGNVYLGVVHRLDKAVAGVVLFAKTSKAASRMSAQFREHNVRKIYVAEVRSVECLPTGVWSDEVAWDETVKRLRIVGEGAGQRAALKVIRVQVQAATSLLELELLTGRKHQIRAQCSHRGAPILGDTRYGAGAGSGEFIHLYAHVLEFPHPTREETIRIEAPLSRAPFQISL